MRQTVPARQNQDIAFVQRPGVNISLTLLEWKCSWDSAQRQTLQSYKARGGLDLVESDYLKGWVKSHFSGLMSPERKPTNQRIALSLLRLRVR